jgi:hypothetical protein
MFAFLKSLFRPPRPAGPPRQLKTFTTSDQTIDQNLTTEEDGWYLGSREDQTVRLFEVHSADVEQCMLTYRVKLKTQDFSGRAYLEMWCRLPGRGEFFSKGLQHPVTGTNDWASYEIPFFLKKGQRPDLIKLNIVVEGKGELWMKEAELLQTPLK